MVMLKRANLEQAAIGIPATGIQDGVFGVVELRDLLFQILMDLLRAADKANGRQSKTISINVLLCSLLQFLIIGKSCSKKR